MQMHASSPGSSLASGRFEILPLRRGGEQWLARADAYSVAMAYVRAEIDVRGDLVEAVRFQLSRSHQSLRARLINALCRITPARLTQGLATRRATARHIRFHYDRSNEFYKLFLDSNLVYSCAYFRQPGFTLDQAQAAKLDHICRKLNLRRGDRFLDIGCGWGALVRHAAARYGAVATGCTLSLRQAEYAAQCVEDEGLSGSARIMECDYRDMQGEFDRISSVGMFEHVGPVQLQNYFRKVYRLLAPGGLFLNHGITRPAPVASDAQSMFITRRVFPGGKLVRLEDVVDAAERAGFEVIDVENLRRHYGLTCRAWVERLSARREECLKHVDEETWRTWQLYLAGSAVAFEDGDLGLHQVLLAKRGDPNAPMTREHMYPR
jgi:cyclopropane-fatty-acyl-phospholipid synthase